MDIYTCGAIYDKECIPCSWKWIPKSISHFLTPRFGGNSKLQYEKRVALCMVIAPKWLRVSRQAWCKDGTLKSLSCLKFKMHRNKHPKLTWRRGGLWMLIVPKWLRVRRQSWCLRNSHEELYKIHEFFLSFFFLILCGRQEISEKKCLKHLEVFLEDRFLWWAFEHFLY